jgi:hypothetical protein
MQFDITKPLPQTTVYNGKKYHLDLCFSTIINIYDLLQNEELSQSDKQQFALAMIVKEKNPPYELLDFIFENYILITKKSENEGPKVVDFKQDGMYIYSSFLHDYGIDLLKEQKTLHWWKFVSLFQGLSESTKMREVLNIRQQKIPQPNKSNGDYINELIKLKRHYALEVSSKERENNLRNGMAKIAEALKARAEAKGR